MSLKSIILIVLMFGLIVFGMFQYTILKRAEMSVEPTPATPSAPQGDPSASETPPTVDPDTSVSDDEVLPPPPTQEQSVSQFPLTAEHIIEDGAHRVVGVISLPTPCYEVAVETLILESYPEQVQVRLTTTSTDDMCIQVVTDLPFESTFAVSENATVSLWLDGQLVKTF